MKTKTVKKIFKLIYKWEHSHDFVDTPIYNEPCEEILKSDWEQEVLNGNI